MLTPSELKTSSKGPGTSLRGPGSRSESLGAARPPRACRPAESPTPSGFLVTPRTCTRREQVDRERRVHVRSMTVSTVKKSSARIPFGLGPEEPSLQVRPSRRGAGPCPFARSRPSARRAQPGATVRSLLSLCNPVWDGAAGESMELRDHAAGSVYRPQGRIGAQQLRDRWWPVR
jgi:hypothetical protein